MKSRGWPNWMRRCLAVHGVWIAWALGATAAEPAKSEVADRWAPFYQPGKVRALILSGRNNHDWRTTTPYLRQLLEDSGRFDVRVAEATDGLTAATLEPYDVLVMDYGGPRWGEGTEQAMEAFVRGGKGFVTVHGATYHFSGLDVITDGHRAVGYKEPAWPGFRQLAGVGWDAMPERGYHGPRHTFTVRVRQAEHPVTRGLPETFRATDELYHGMTVVPGAEVLATAYSDPDRGGTGRDEPMLVATSFGAGRGFYTALGHELAAMWEPGFRSTFLRGVEWAATGKVTLPADAGWKAVEREVLRVRVVTGGHSYEPSFYTLFEGQPGLEWNHATTPEEALGRDLLPSTDVLVLYNMSQDLNDTQRRHLESFANSGRGIVVLHHALANYQKWEAWWKEIVGARYVLEGEPGYPGSTYHHDQWMECVPAGRHPIVDGVGPMRLLDETYHGVWQAPGILPLLRTDHPKSDAVLAWISPWEKARVVGIQPGHDAHSYRNPAYRQLVLNAIRWAAGK